MAMFMFCQVGGTPEAPHCGHSHFSHRPQAQAECPQGPTDESGL